jgi:hypothetical protein
VGLDESVDFFFFFFFLLSAFSFSFAVSSSDNSSSALASSDDFVSPESCGLRVGVQVELDFLLISAFASNAQSKAKPAASSAPISQVLEFGATIARLQMRQRRRENLKTVR